MLILPLLLLLLLTSMLLATPAVADDTGQVPVRAGPNDLPHGPRGDVR